MKFIFGIISAIYLTFIFVSTTKYKSIQVEKFISEDKKIVTIKNKKEDKKIFELYLKELNFKKNVSEFNCNQTDNTINCSIDNEKYQFNNTGNIKIEDFFIINGKTFEEMKDLKSSDIDIKGLIFFTITLIIYFLILFLMKKTSLKTIKKVEIKKTEEKESVLIDLLTKQTMYIFILITTLSIAAIIVINYNYQDTFNKAGVKKHLKEEDRLGLKQIELDNGKMIIKGLSGISENSSNYLNSKGKMINGGSNKIDIYTNNTLTENVICNFDTFFNCEIQGKKLTFNVSEDNVFINNIDFKTAKIYIENKIEEKENNYNKIIKAIGIIYLAALGFLVLSKTFYRIF